MVDVDKQFGGNTRTPWSPQIKPFFCRFCAVPRALPCAAAGPAGQCGALRWGAQVSFLRLDGFPGVEWGHAPLLRLGRRGGPSVPLRPAAPQGARTHAFPHPAPLPSDEWEQ